MSESATITGFPSETTLIENYEQAYQQWKSSPTPLIERLRAIREEQLETV